MEVAYVSATEVKAGFLYTSKFESRDLVSAESSMTITIARADVAMALEKRILGSFMLVMDVFS